MQETHRDRLDARGYQLLAEREHFGIIERRQNLAARVEPLMHFVAQLARYQRARPLEVDVECIGPVAAADFVDIAKASCRDQCGSDATALEYRIDRDGRTMQELV